MFLLADQESINCKRRYEIANFDAGCRQSVTWYPYCAYMNPGMTAGIAGIKTQATGCPVGGGTPAGWHMHQISILAFKFVTNIQYGPELKFVWCINDGKPGYQSMGTKMWVMKRQYYHVNCWTTKEELYKSMQLFPVVLRKRGILNWKPTGSIIIKIQGFSIASKAICFVTFKPGISQCTNTI